MEENKSQIIVYQTEEGETKLDVRFQEETVWLTQKLMAELFQSSVPNINRHLKNIFDDGALEESRTIKDFLTVQKEGNRAVKKKQVFYNLDAIIYRILLKCCPGFIFVFDTFNLEDQERILEMGKDIVDFVDA